MKSLEGSKVLIVEQHRKVSVKQLQLAKTLLCEACIIQPRELIYQDHSMVKL